MKFLSLFAFITVFAVACSNDDNNTTVTSQDVYFMQQASYSNFDEMAAGSIAASKGNYDSVRIFGTMMLSDHGMAEEELDSLANQFSTSIPSAPDSLHSAMAVQLQALSGNVFDTTYIGAQVRDHMTAIAIFQQELASGNNQQVKDYANKYLPVIQMHLAMAQRIQLQIQ